MEESSNDKLIGYAIDDNGFIIDTVLVGGNFDYIYSNVITVPYNSEYHRNRWDGEKWIEGETEEEKTERESQQLLESLKPSPEEIANAELEIKMLTMLTDLGVIQ